MIVEQLKKYIKQFLEQQNSFEEVGTVSELREKRIAIVKCNSTGSCSGCAAAWGCCSGNVSDGKQIFADNVPHARVGDIVRIQIETSAGMADSQSFLYIASFIMLVIGLGVGYFIATYLPVGVPAVLLSLLIGAAFMLGGIGVLRLGRPAVIQKSLAKITEIISTTKID